MVLADIHVHSIILVAYLFIVIPEETHNDTGVEHYKVEALADG